MAITKFIPEIWSANILANLRDTLVYAQPGVVNRDYEGEIAQAGDTVHITAFNDPAVRPYTKNNDITWDLLTDTQQSLVVDQADYLALTVDAIDRRRGVQPRRGGGRVRRRQDGGRDRRDRPGPRLVHRRHQRQDRVQPVRRDADEADAEQVPAGGSVGRRPARAHRRPASGRSVH